MHNLYILDSKIYHKLYQKKEAELRNTCCCNLKCTSVIMILTNKAMLNLHILFDLYEWILLHTLLKMHSCFSATLSEALLPFKPKKTLLSLFTYLNGYLQSTDTKASSACVYRAAEATLDLESQWAHSASDTHLFRPASKPSSSKLWSPCNFFLFFFFPNPSGFACPSRAIVSCPGVQILDSLWVWAATFVFPKAQSMHTILLCGALKAEAHCSLLVHILQVALRCKM